MPHLLVIAALVVVAWILLCIPLGVLVGRRLRAVNPAALPPGCALRGGRDGFPPPPGRPGAPVPGCTARPCRALRAPADLPRSCAEPNTAGGGRDDGRGAVDRH